ncbi:Hpt domain-containing protein [Mesorhizobium sp. CA10]|uniref:Hpt domain-containing protein n=1 Tax=Mesorhizobium sp. CA10 TaxID=588495 RepID=UPI001CCDEA5D|nr:Hpt domain-containing protein [Mesorhizobium sp. CA10]MBZ9883041.1 Hpt domain-containing protein [Mesorhizobium sp. CA10]
MQHLRFGFWTATTRRRAANGLEDSVTGPHSTTHRFLLEYPVATRERHSSPPIPFVPLRQHFLACCADQLAELKAIALQATPLPGNDPLIRFTHSLADAAGTFGFAGISARARPG